MVRISRPLPYLFLAGSALVLANPHQSTNSHSSSRDLVARSQLPNNGLSAANQLEARTLLGWLFDGLHGHRTRCPSSFKCNGSGTDGYAYDSWGNSCPGHLPSGWHYFGADVGWAPPRSWSCSSTFTFSSSAAGACSKATWWQGPGRGWQKRGVSFTIPRWWGVYVDRSWSCSKDGRDGQIYDWQGNTLPSGLPSGWLWFGVDLGWGPPLGWTIPSINWVPSASASGSLKVCSWWAPSIGWNVPSGFTIPSFWAGLGWKNSAWPSKSWQCSGSGRDGLTIDWQGNTLPSGLPSGWLWFGVDLGWGPPLGWTIPSINWVPSASASGSLKVCSWWAPSIEWNVPSGFTVPSFWAGLGWKNSAWPSKSWQCSGSGRDGLTIDWQGNTLPSGLPSGWLWFGVDLGWGPPLGWTIPSINWVPSASASGSLKVCSWWAPSIEWNVPSGFTVPSFWAGLGWKNSAWPSKSWQCSGSGRDGLTIDWQGNTLPSGYPAGWLWFGISVGWAPHVSWQCPAGNAWVPKPWIPKIPAWTWWSPPASWTPPAAVTSMPSFWSCSPGASKTSTPAPAATTSTAASCSPQWAQCGGISFTGASCCPNSFTCSYVNQYYSQCQPAADSTTTKAPTTSNSPAATTTKVASTTQRVTTTKKATTTSQAAVTTKPAVSKTTSKVATTTKKVTSSVKATTTHKAETTSKKPATTSKVATSTKKVTTSVKATTTKAVTTSKKPSATKTATREPVTVYQPVTQTVIIVHEGTTVVQTQTVTQVSPPAPTSNNGWPSGGWTCRGDGKDGFEVDHNGKGCPAQYPSGWLWFGVSVGWAPPHGWVPSPNWVPSSSAASSCTVAVWWAPPSTWIVPAGFTIPAFWYQLGWSNAQWPSKNWQCNGSGKDGWEVDWQGNSRPAGFDIGFMWFGVGRGWQPKHGWVNPIRWNPPSLWVSRHATWWSPSRTWHVSNGYRCQKWWNRSVLRGSWVWAL